MEEDLHGPGIDARGAAFPGVNLYVELGHGRDYAWSATTATSDNVDTFAEVLCQDELPLPLQGPVPGDGKARTTRTPGLRTRSDKTPAGDRNADRLPHRARHRLRARHGRRQEGRVRQRAHDLLPRGRLGDRLLRAQRTRRRDRPAAVPAGGLEDQLPLQLGLRRRQPHRLLHVGLATRSARRRTSPDFPILGTGQYDWKGYEPDAAHDATWLPFAAHPNAIDPAFLVSWNNKQAPRWSAADDKYAFGSVYRMQLIAELHRSRHRGRRRRWGSQQLVSAMDEAATQDIRTVELSLIIRGARHAGEPAAAGRDRRAGTLVRAPAGTARDLATAIATHDLYTTAITIMDAWWPKLLQPSSADARRRSLRRGREHAAVRRRGPGVAAPDFADGWYGLRQQGPAPRLFASGTSAAATARRTAATLRAGDCRSSALRSRCRAALQASLLAALSGHPAADLRQDSACPKRPGAGVLRTRTAGPSVAAISLPPFPFQNRPTFQQVVTLTRKLPR